MVWRYMDNKKGNKYYINKILFDLDFIIEYTKDIFKSEFGKNELLLDSIMFRDKVDWDF